MTDIFPFELITHLDWIALAALFFFWIALTQVIERAPKRKPSTSQLMARYREEWMVQFVTRSPRIFDAQIVANLRQGTAFFASTSMIAIGGGLALIGNAERLQGVASDLTQVEAPLILWEVKVLVMLVFATNAFLKFVWSHRLFGYCAVLMAAVPNTVDNPVTMIRARKAAAINVAAARGYNRGLRSVYFGFASIAWLLGPIALMVTTGLTVLVILRREFASASRAVLLEPEETSTRT